MKEELKWSVLDHSTPVCVCVRVCAHVRVSDLISFSPLVWITCRICLGVMGASEKFSKTCRRGETKMLFYTISQLLLQ